MTNHIPTQNRQIHDRLPLDNQNIPGSQNTRIPESVAVQAERTSDTSTDELFKPTSANVEVASGKSLETSDTQTLSDSQLLRLASDKPDQPKDIKLPKSEILATNKQTELNLARIASESPAAHATVDALINTVFELFVTVENFQNGNNGNNGADGDNQNPANNSEFKVFQKLANDYAKHNEITTTAGDASEPKTSGPNYSAIGQLSTGGFTKIISEARAFSKSVGTPPSTTQQKNAGEPVSFREKGTALFSLTNGPQFRKTLETIHKNPALQQAVSHLVDIDLLTNLSFGPPRRGNGPDELKLYTYKSDNPNPPTQSPEHYQGISEAAKAKSRPDPVGPGGSLTAIQRDLRQAPDVAGFKSTGTTAANLKSHDRLTQREETYHQSNPVNHPSNWGNGALSTGRLDNADQETIVGRANGEVVWTVDPSSPFGLDAGAKDLPVVAAPSGTTDRFLTATRILGPGATSTLQLNTPKGNETLEQTEARASDELKELGRWFAAAYLVDDNHHSLLEVNLGASNHGLEAQWDSSTLYTQPFSAPIESPAFSISNESVAEDLSKLEAPVPHIVPSFTPGLLDSRV